MNNGEYSGQIMVYPRFVNPFFKLDAYLILDKMTPQEIAEHSKRDTIKYNSTNYHALELKDDGDCNPVPLSEYYIETSLKPYGYYDGKLNLRTG